MRIIFLVIVLISFKINSQISVQAIGYWNNNEKYEFQGTYQKYKVKEKDTIFEVDTKYDIVVKIIDSTANSYKVEWLYKNHKFIKGNKIAKLLTQPEDSIRIIFKTDELGAFQEVLNMDELLSYYKNRFSLLEKKIRDSELKPIINSIKNKFKSETFINNNSYRDLLNYYTFHGGKYELKEEYNGNLKTANNYGGEPFDTEVNAWLDEIDSENNNFILRSYQKIDPQQLKTAISKHLGIPENNLPNVTNETYIVNRIHGSGWTTYSRMTREVNSGQDKNVEEFIIMMK